MNFTVAGGETALLTRPVPVYGVRTAGRLSAAPGRRDYMAESRSIG